MADHTTVWLPIGPVHPVIAATGTTSAVMVPVFIEGPEFEEFNETRQISISPKALLFGVLLHAREEPPGVDAVEFRGRVPALLEVLARGFGVDGVERLVCDVAAHFRSHHGIDYGLTVLENGLALFPQFHLVRSDLVCALWGLAEKASEVERPAFLKRMLQAFAALERGRLSPGPRAFVCYAAVAATATINGLSDARELFAELSAEIRAGDEGELVKNLDNYLAREGLPWSALHVQLE